MGDVYKMLIEALQSAAFRWWASMLDIVSENAMKRILWSSRNGDIFFLFHILEVTVKWCNDDTGDRCGNISHSVQLTDANVRSYRCAVWMFVEEMILFFFFAVKNFSGKILMMGCETKSDNWTLMITYEWFQFLINDGYSWWGPPPLQLGEWKSYLR